MAVLLGLLLPAVPAVEPAPPAAPAVAPGELGGAPGVLVAPGALLVEPAPPAVELGALEPIRAFVNVYWPAGRALEAAPAVPLVPVAPDVLPPPCRHPTTVMARLAPLEV